MYYKTLANRKRKSTKDMFTAPLKPPLNIWSEINTKLSKKYYHIKYDIPKDIIIKWKQLIPTLQYNIDTKKLIISTKDELKALAILYLIYLNTNKIKTFTSIVSTNEINNTYNDISSNINIKNNIINIINTNINYV